MSTSKPYKNCLILYVLWHDKFKEGQRWANLIYSTFNRNNYFRPLSRGIGIPVFFRYGSDKFPSDIDLDDAEHSAVILLVDDNMVSDVNWENYINTLWERIENSDGKHRLFPVALSPSSFNLSSIISLYQFIRIHGLQKRARVLIRQLSHELSRLLLGFPSLPQLCTGQTTFSPPPLKLFLSHAKRDGEKITKRIRNYINEETGLRTFFDALDIPAGRSFSDELKDNIKNSNLLLVVQTDAYASRQWCLNEVIYAKQCELPVIVVNAIQCGEMRSFPYLGNVPVIRWNSEKDIPKVINLALLETLRYRYTKLYLKDFSTLFHAGRKYEILSCPPELFSLVHMKSLLKDSEFIVYPDPPLSYGETQVIDLVEPGCIYLTPTMIPTFF